MTRILILAALLATSAALSADSPWRRQPGIERIAVGCRWNEGPVYFGDGRYLLWSDIPNNRIMRWDEETGRTSVFRKPSNFANGHTRDRQGRLVSCEHDTRRVTRTDYDGTITVVLDKFDGKPLNSPNDVVVKSDDSIWFSDPSYGIDSNYEGFQAPSEIGERRVYRIDPRNGSVRVVADGFAQPNGLAFSLDERRMYIVDSGKGRGIMRVFDVHDDELRGGDVFVECADGMYDGLRIDVDDRIWTSAGEAVHCHERDGTLIGRIVLPERVANLCFGGPKRNRLYITATSSLYSVLLAVSGAKTF